MGRWVLIVVLTMFTSTAIASTEDDVTLLYKQFIAEKNACGDYDCISETCDKYATQKYVAVSNMNKQLHMNIKQETKDMFFKIAKLKEFDASELDITNITIDGDKAVMNYSVARWPDFKGSVEFTREQDVWKIGTISEQGGSPEGAALEQEMISKAFGSSDPTAISGDNTKTSAQPASSGQTQEVVLATYTLGPGEEQEVVRATSKPKVLGWNLLGDTERSSDCPAQGCAILYSEDGRSCYNNIGCGIQFMPKDGEIKVRIKNLATFPIEVNVCEM